MSSIITISQPPSIPGDRKKPEVPTEMTFAFMDPDMDPAELEMIAEYDAARVDSASESDDGGSTSESDAVSLPLPLPEEVALARDKSLAKLQGTTNGESSKRHSKRNSVESRIIEKKPALRRRMTSGPDAVIVLKEERVSLLSPYI